MGRGRPGEASLLLPATTALPSDEERVYIVGLSSHVKISYRDCHIVRRINTCIVLLCKTVDGENVRICEEWMLRLYHCVKSGCKDC